MAGKETDLKILKITTVADAKTLWDIPEVKSRIRESVRKKSLNRWNEELTGYVLRHAKDLSPKLQPELEEAIIFVGEELKAWNEFLLKSMHVEDYKFAEVTYLTPLGSIDESQIMEKYWLGNRESLEKGTFLDLACMLGQEKIVYESRYEIVDQIKKLLSLTKSVKEAKRYERRMVKELDDIKYEDDAINFVLINWLNTQYKHLDPKGYIKTRDEVGLLTLPQETIRYGYEIRKSILLMSFRLGYTHLFKYFFDKWSHMFNVDVICDHMVKACKRISNRLGGLTDYQKKKHLEIVLGVMDGMDEMKEAEIIDNNYEIFLEMTVCYLPHQEFFLKIFHNNVDRISSDKQWMNIFELIVKEDLRDYDSNCPVEKKAHRRKMLEQVLAETSPDVKENRDVVSCLAETYTLTFNIPNLKIMLNYSESLTVKSITRVIYNWVKQDEIHLHLPKLLEELGDDRELLIERIRTHVIFRLLSDNNVAKLDELLRIPGLEYDADILEFIKYKCYHRFDLTEKFIQWLQKSENYIKVKNFFATEETIRDYVFSFLFCDGQYFQKDYAEKFLNLIFSNKEEIKNLKLNVLLKDENSILQFALCCDKWQEPWLFNNPETSFFPIEKLIKFCELPDEKVLDLKNKCIANIEQLMYTYASNCITFLILNDLINWLFKSEEDRQKVIGKFMKSSTAIVLCNKMLSLSTSLEPFSNVILLKFYNTWVKTCENIPQIKKDLLDMNIEKLNEADETKLSIMFNKLERDQNLDFSDVFYFVRDNK